MTSGSSMGQLETVIQIERVERIFPEPESLNIAPKLRAQPEPILHEPCTPHEPQRHAFTCRPQQDVARLL